MKAMVVDAVTKYYQKAFERSTQGWPAWPGVVHQEGVPDNIQIAPIIIEIGRVNSIVGFFHGGKNQSYIGLVSYKDPQR